MTFVLDCPVAMSWAFLDEAPEATDRRRDSLIEGRAFVPALWPAEVGNVQPRDATVNGAERRVRASGRPLRGNHLPRAVPPGPPAPPTRAHAALKLCRGSAVVNTDEAAATRRLRGRTRRHREVGNPAEPSQRGVFLSNVYTPAIMSARTTATARAPRSDRAAARTARPAGADARRGESLGDRGRRLRSGASPPPYRGTDPALRVRDLRGRGRQGVPGDARGARIAGLLDRLSREAGKLVRPPQLDPDPARSPVPPGSSPAPVRRRVDSGGAGGAIGEKGAARGLEPEACRDGWPLSWSRRLAQRERAGIECDT